MKAGWRSGMKSPFRWLLAAARYAAASLMTVLILIVMVKGIKVLLQPESLSLSVNQGCVFVWRSDLGTPKLKFQFTVRMVVIPRSGARMYFRNISAYLFDKDTPATSSSPSDDCDIFFDLDDITAPPLQDVSVMKSSDWLDRDPDYVVLSFFDMLYNRSHDDSTSDMTLRLDGTVSQVTSTWSYNRATTYYCWPLAVGLDRGADTVQGNYLSMGLEDVFCREEQGKHLI